MISKEEMYEFASQIAGITDSDLEAYRCGGKAKMKKKSGGGNILDDVKNVFTPVRKQIDKKLKEKTSSPASGSVADNIKNSKKVKPGSHNYGKEEEAMRVKALKERDRDRKVHPNWYDNNGNYIGPENDTNENTRQPWMKKSKKAEGGYLSNKRFSNRKPLEPPTRMVNDSTKVDYSKPHLKNYLSVPENDPIARWSKEPTRMNPANYLKKSRKNNK